MTEYIRELEAYLLKEGYGKVRTAGGLGSFWAKEEGKKIVLITLFFEELPGQRKVPLTVKIEEAVREKNRIMIQTGREADQLFLMVKKSNPSMEEIREGQNWPNLWFLDRDDGQVLIYENQITSYHGLRAGLETFMEDARSKKADRDRSELFRTFTPVNTSIVLVNILAFLWLIFMGDSQSAVLIEKYGGMTWDGVINGKEYYRILTSMFLHFGPVHLMQNMLILLVTGSRLERIAGKVRYGLIYLFSGISSAAASLYFTLMKSPGAVAAGASGAIFGVMGGLLALILLDLAGGQKKRVREIGPLGILFMIGSALYYGFSAAGVDNAAHVGGLVGGFLLTGLLFLADRNRSL